MGGEGGVGAQDGGCKNCLYTMDCVIKTREIFKFLPLMNNYINMSSNFLYWAYLQSYYQIWWIFHVFFPRLYLSIFEKAFFISLENSIWRTFWSLKFYELIFSKINILILMDLYYTNKFHQGQADGSLNLFKKLFFVTLNHQ